MSTEDVMDTDRDPEDERRSGDALRAIMDAAMARTWDACLKEAIARLGDLATHRYPRYSYVTSVPVRDVVNRDEMLAVLRAMMGKMPRSTPNPSKP